MFINEIYSWRNYLLECGALNLQLLFLSLVLHFCLNNLCVFAKFYLSFHSHTGFIPTCVKIMLEAGVLLILLEVNHISNFVSRTS